MRNWKPFIPIYPHSYQEICFPEILPDCVNLELQPAGESKKKEKKRKPSTIKKKADMTAQRKPHHHSE